MDMVADRPPLGSDSAVWRADRQGEQRAGPSSLRAPPASPTGALSRLPSAVEEPRRIVWRLRRGREARISAGLFR